MKPEFTSELPRLIAGMDGRGIIPKNIAKIDAKDGDLSSIPITAGDAVDFAIWVAFTHAERQGEDLREVACHLRYITDQLMIFRRNVEAEVDAMEAQIARETHHAKTA